MQADGSFQPYDAPGPDSFDTWEKCFAVWEVIMLMVYYPAAKEGDPGTPIMDPIALETYYENFKEIARENSEAWRLCCQAEDRCRAEHLPRVWRKLREEKKCDPTWSECLITAAEDNRYWDRAVRRPALQYIARNKRPPTGDDENDQPQKKTKNQRKKEARASRFEEARVNLVPNIGSKGKGKGKDKGRPHPRKGRFGYETTKDGQQVCFKFATGGPSACPAPCKFNRAHVCQRCLQPHPNDSEACTMRD